MKLHELKPAAGSKHSRKRVGRGDASGHGSTSTRGNKGARSRSGFSLSFNFEGGQMPLMRRLPKRGFTHISADRWTVINLATLETKFTAGQEISPEILVREGLVRKGRKIKILGEGVLTKNLLVSAHGISEKARQKIEKAGGTASLVPFTRGSSTETPQAS